MKIFLIAANTFKEAIRQRFVLAAGIVALLLTASAKFFLKLDLGHEQLKFVFDFSSGALNFFGVIMAVAAACSIMSAETENKTVVTLMSKPVGAFDFAAGKICGVAAALGVFVLAVFAAAAVSLFATALQLNGLGIDPPNPPNYISLALYCVSQWLKLCLCAAMATVVCSLARSFLFAVSVSFLCVFCAAIGNALVWLGGGNWASEAVSVLLPDLRILDACEPFVFAQPDLKIFAEIFAYSAIYILSSAAVSAFFYSKRDL